jgi:type II secretion system protein C
MVSKHSSKKSLKKISPKTAEKIVSISLRHPKLGAQRLVPLLKKERISVSASAIMSILRREGLQNSKQRLAQVEKRSKKIRKTPSAHKTPTIKITDEVAKRICEISMQNPGFGAGRLMPLLQKEGIFASSSTVYRTLKRHGLQTREKRLTKTDESLTESVIIPKTFPKKIPPEIEDRIAEISLQNPEYGARRLFPLLQQEEIFVSVSAVYRILKRNELENRQKRLLKLEALQATEIPPKPEATETELIEKEAEVTKIPAIGEVPEPFFDTAVAAPESLEDKAAELAEEPEPIPELVAAETTEPVQPKRPLLRKTPIKTIKKRGHWVFYPLYLLLLLLIGYLGFQTVQAIQYARLETGIPIIEESSIAEITIRTKSDTTAQPLDSYRQIWVRNLFNAGSVKEPDLSKKIALAKFAPAKKGLGLELVGTVVADDPILSRAIIDNRNTRKQEAYREGDSAGKAKIKKILRNNVVITTADGDELLTVEIKESGRIAPSMLSKRVGSQASFAQQAPGTRQARTRTLSLNLKRDEVAASLTDIEGLMKQMPVTPYMQGEEPSGFRITRIPRDSVLRKMGLRSRDVIVGIDNETITGPEQATDFFQRLAGGGEVTIKIKRRRRTRQIKLKIE